MATRGTRAAAMLVGAITLGGVSATGQGRTVTVALEYGAPGNGPVPNFSPKGTQVALTDVPATLALPEGARRPAKVGILHLGEDPQGWMRVLATADAEHPQDLCHLYLDRNRNGRFDDDGPELVAVPAQNEKTKAWWSSFAKTELQVPYPADAHGPVLEPYLVTFWIVRDSEAAPTVARFSVASWRAGTATIDGVPALVAVMDANNDAVFNQSDMWSVLAASEPDAAKRVLSIAEARTMNRLMFLETADRERVLEFRRISPDGRSLELAVVDRAITKKADRAPDDAVGPERARPRAETPFVWAHGHAGYAEAVARAKATGRQVLVDFEATWCGPCKLMDEWIWSDQEVAALLSARYVGVKLDGDLEGDLVDHFNVHGYPAGVIVDATGTVHARFDDYQSSADLLKLLRTVTPKTTR
jgi:thiol-disulfide isomerase/thioredoxin